jgi:predicted TIM-barrel enzyme
VTRAEILAALRAQASAGRLIIGAGAGTGLSAKCEEQAGADLIIIYNSGRYRMAGRGSTAGLLPYGDANAIVVEMAAEVLPVVRRTPVLAGVCGTDPFRLMPVFLRQLRDMGFAGVQNYPTVCLFEGMVRANLEETGMGFQLEVDMIRAAHELDLLTVPYAHNSDEASAMAEAGADVVVAHLGLTTSGSIGARTAVSLDDGIALIQAIHDAAREARDDVIVLCHGGPLATPDDVRLALARVRGVDGFFGASSMERLPVEEALTARVREFKGIPHPNGVAAR